MDMINLNGKDFKVYKHMKDIQENTENGILFKRWYNKNQFLKHILGRFEFDGEAEYNTFGDFGKLAGSVIWANPPKGDSWYIQIYKLDDMTAENLDDFIEHRLDEDFIATGFILEANDGTLYAVDTNIS